MKEISIILPAYNEEETLQKCVEGVKNALEDRDFEIIIVEDGCEDQTEKEAAKAAEDNRVRHIHSDKRLGKGKAIGQGIEISEGKIIGFIDSDLSVPCKELAKALNEFDSTDDILIGSRYLESSECSRNGSRLISSKIYNFLASKILGTGVKDHQCGLKLFRREVWDDISENISNDRWFWDTSLIFEGKKSGFNVREIGIEWEKSEDSGVSTIRDGPLMLEKIIEAKLDEKNIPIDVRYGRFAIIGGLAAILNTGILYTLTEYFDLYYILSSGIAIETAIILMFFANNRFTFEKKKEGMEIITGILKSNLVRSFGVLTNIGLLYTLTEFLNIYYLISNILALFIASIVNFIGEKKFTWEE